MVISLGSASTGNYPFWKAKGTGLFVHSPLGFLIAVIRALPWPARLPGTLEAQYHLPTFLVHPRAEIQDIGQGQGSTLGDMDSTLVATLVL